MTSKLGFFFAALILLTAQPSNAAEAKPDTKSVAWVQVSHVIKSVNLQIETTPPRTLGLWEARGVVMYPDQDIAQMEMAATSEANETTVTSSGYMFYDFADGSRQSIKFSSTAPWSNDANAEHSGTIEFLSGSGQYEGITGKGRFTATQHGETIVFKIEATYVLSPNSSKERTVLIP